MWAASLWPVTLSHGSIKLRPLRSSDRAAWVEVRYRNRAWLSPWDATDPDSGQGVHSFRDLLHAMREQAKAGVALPFAVVESENGLEYFAGQLTVSNIVWGSARSAALGYWLDQARAGRGIMPASVALVTDHCFRIGLHRVEINIRPENGPSLRVVKKLGFRDEGLRERYLHIDGQWADHRTFALTAEEIPEGVLMRWMRTGAADRS